MKAKPTRSTYRSSTSARRSGAWWSATPCRGCSSARTSAWPAP